MFCDQLQLQAAFGIATWKMAIIFLASLLLIVLLLWFAFKKCECEIEERENERGERIGLT